jgi:hypothetical protein
MFDHSGALHISVLHIALRLDFGMIFEIEIFTPLEI